MFLLQRSSEMCDVRRSKTSIWCDPSLVSMYFLHVFIHIHMHTLLMNVYVSISDDACVYNTLEESENQNETKWRQRSWEINRYWSNFSLIFILVDVFNTHKPYIQYRLEGRYEDIVHVCCVLRCLYVPGS